MYEEHAVQLYVDGARLTESVAAFFAAGLEVGDGAVALSTAEHADAIRAALVARGLPVEELELEEQLLFADAASVLAEVLERGRPSAGNFGRVVEPLLARVAGPDGSRPVRAFGELVDLLQRRGEARSADALEQLWNRLLERRRFSLLCGYFVEDPFRRDVQVSLLPQIYRTHGRVHPPGDPEQLREAVDAALEESLGPHDARRVYELALAHRRDERVPAPQLALMWMSAHMPRAAERVLAAPRERYAAA